MKALSILKIVIMEKSTKLNVISIAITIIMLIYIRLVLTDNPISWIIPEGFLWLIPVFFVVTLILSIISVRTKTNFLGTIMIVISSIAFLITLLGLYYIWALGTGWHN
jgi:hypothetical protein